MACWPIPWFQVHTLSQTLRRKMIQEDTRCLALRPCVHRLNKVHTPSILSAIDVSGTRQSCLPPFHLSRDHSDGSRLIGVLGGLS